MRYTEKERKILSNLYESENWRVYRKHFIENRQLELAQTGIFQRDMDIVHETRGRVMEGRYIEDEMRKIHKKETS